MVRPGGPEARGQRDRSSHSEPGRIAVLARRIARARSRFVAIARSDGLGAALAKAGRKVGKRLEHYRRAMADRLGARRCPYFTPPTRLDPYDAWRRVNADNPRRRRRIDAALRPHGPSPRFSILVPVYRPPADVFRDTVDSALAQSYPDWELILVANGCPDPQLPRLIDDFARRDPRIKALHRPTNGHISAATNQAAAAAAGEFLVLLDSDDLLDPDALAHLAIHLDRHPGTDLVYSDEDQVDDRGRPHSPQFKPDWSPELLLSFCYLGHLAAIRRSLYEAVGGMRSACDGSQDHDLWLRASERTDRIGHVPQVLYHWRIVHGSGAAHWSPSTFEAGRLAVEEAFRRRGIGCPVVQSDWAARAGCAIYEPVMPDDGPSVAILIPSRNHATRLRIALDSLARTTYRNYRIYVIDNESDDPETLAYLERLPHRVLRIGNPDGRFSFAAINNQAAAMVEEELLVFLNDDTEVINPRWLSQMVGWSRLEGVGAVGARLLFPDDRVQHAGVSPVFHEGIGGHSFRLLPWWDAGTLNLARVSHNALAVTAACMLTPRRLFLDLGGFDEKRFAVAYNDPDYCYRLGDAGYRCVYCGEAELYHHEGLSRGFGDDPREVAAFREAYSLRDDPYFNPNLDMDVETYRTKPTVVPIGPRSEPVPVLAVTHNLNWEGAPRIEFEIVRRLHTAGAIRAEVLSPIDGPLRAAYEELGIPIRVDTELAPLSAPYGTPDYYRATIRRLAGWIAGRDYDVVHANTMRAFWAIDAARIAGIPSVWSVHESEPWRVYFNDLPPAVAATALSCLAYPYRVIFSARSTMQVWSEINTSDNYELIRYAHDIPQVRRAMGRVGRPRARRELKVRDGEVCVLLLGTVCERKGQHDLLHAFAALPDAIVARMRCLVVGARDHLEYSRQLREMAAALPEGRRHRFVVLPETGETSAYWQAADVFCCTSRIECYPLVTMEAMAAGLPIVTTPVFGLSEQVRPGINSLIFEPGDTATLAGHLALLVQYDAIRKSMARASADVLRTLPDDAYMNERYRRILRAAAESAPLFPGEPEEERGGEGRDRVWFVEESRGHRPAPRHHRVAAK